VMLVYCLTFSSHVRIISFFDRGLIPSITLLPRTPRMYFSNPSSRKTELWSRLQYGLEGM